ncbi:UPF0301 protein [Formosimonas limnophila]|uniref:UPF0301 protein GCM10009007_13600 n=1 Tax=Formosimonas limnophila TaxID=1384487 RepID=A0A8J3CHQ4_9BURK|nr:UPF0301 protein [Formosimonas limnophila]
MNTNLSKPQITNLNAPTNLVGQFLIAMPSQLGDAFERTVVYVCEHNASGALGLVVNRSADVTISDVLTKLDVVDEMSIQYAAHASESVLVGGPVQTERGFVLHAPFHEYAATIKINDNVGLTSSRDILEDLARGQGPDKMLLALGYAGWSAGQLEAELARNAWLTVPADEHVLFETLPRERYQQAMRLLGFDAAMLSDQAGHA